MTLTNAEREARAAAYEYLHALGKRIEDRGGNLEAHFAEMAAEMQARADSETKGDAA